jgi:hypothetical protein
MPVNERDAEQRPSKQDEIEWNSKKENWLGHGLKLLKNRRFELPILMRYCRNSLARYGRLSEPRARGGQYSFIYRYSCRIRHLARSESERMLTEILWLLGITATAIAIAWVIWWILNFFVPND